MFGWDHEAIIKEVLVEDKRIKAAEALSAAAKNIAAIETQLQELDSKVMAFAGQDKQDDSFRRNEVRTIVTIDSKDPMFGRGGRPCGRCWSAG